MIVLRADTRAMNLVRKTMADRDIRYYLNGIHFEPAPIGGIIVVTTNGHCLTAVHDPRGYCAEPVTIGIPFDVWKHCDKPLPSGNRKNRKRAGVESNHLVVDRSTNNGTSDYGDLILGDRVEVNIETFFGDNIKADRGLPVWRAPIGRNCIVDGRWPDWRRILPKTAEEWASLTSVNAWLSAQYIGDLMLPSSRENSVGGGVRFWQRPFKEGEEQPTNSDAVFVQHDGFPEMVQAIMPRRGALDNWPEPAVVQQPKAAA